MDQRDSSLCRSEAALCQVFAQAGLKILGKKSQEEWPEKLLPVFWNVKEMEMEWGGVVDVKKWLRKETCLASK